MDYYISVVLIGISAVLSSFAGLPIFKIIQLSGYKASGVTAWWKATSFDTLIRYAALMLFAFVAMIVFVGCFSTFDYARYCAAALYIILATVFICSVVKRKDGAVKFTGRMKRLIAVHIFIMLLLGAGAALATHYSPYCQTLTAAFGILTPFVVFVANFIASPFEKLNNNKYIKRAKVKLAEKRPIVIGITGSYGKTTTKSLLEAMLKTKYSVLATPGSFNTPMGVCMTVNNDLSDQQCFIAEMGARHKGDIKELCDIVSPAYGIITAVGDMHLETFGTRAAVADAKFELAACLPENGLAVFNGKNAPCAELAEREMKCRFESTCADGRVGCDNISIGSNGTTFDLIIDGNKYETTTRLLGLHIPELVCCAAAVALELGVTPEAIVGAVATAEPVEHRLQLVSSPDPLVTVIDDAYNSNPVGARNALEVLGKFDAKKIIITPGFVELGAIEKECNTELGKSIAGVCDYAFLVGSHAEDIKKGAVEAGMVEACVCVYPSRDEAVAALETIAGARVILFENDLPDNIK